MECCQQLEDPLDRLLNHAQVISEDGVNRPKSTVMCDSKLMDGYLQVFPNGSGDRLYFLDCFW
jgi:hypothetical protein